MSSTPDVHEPPRTAAAWLVALHLAPGLVFTALLVVCSPVFARHGLGAYLAALLLVPSCLAPMFAAIVLLWNRRSGLAFVLARSSTYCERGSLRDYFLWPVLLYLCWAPTSLVVVPLSGFLEATLFGWFPTQLNSRTLIDGVAAGSIGQRQATFVLAILLSGVLAPLLEEAYFRGFLLRRMSHLGWKAPILNVFLFGLYHFFCPWNLPGIFLAFLPVAFVVQARENWRIGFVLHAMYNLTGVLTLFLPIL